MGIYRTVLIVFVVFFGLSGCVVLARQNACLTCHRSHHTERGGCVGCHRGNDRTDRKEIAHHDIVAGRFAHFTINFTNNFTNKGRPIVERGKKLLDVLACRRCHTYGGKGNRLATNLARPASKAAPQGIFDSIESPVLFMPNFHCDDVQISALVNAILSGTESAGAKGEETPQLVHFEDQKQSGENSFLQRCGPCHKVLSESLGGLGNGDIGPNLSGLLSEHYPGTNRHTGPWTPDELKRWLENPRNIRANARMKPVRLRSGEFGMLLEIMGVNAEVYPQRGNDNGSESLFQWVCK